MAAAASTVLAQNGVDFPMVRLQPAQSIPIPQVSMQAVTNLDLSTRCTMHHHSQFHVRPTDNWVNDPCGPFYDPQHKLYHISMQYNPGAAVWGNMSWAHFTSSEMVHWQSAGLAMVPSEPYDSAGVFTGSVTMVDGEPTVVYTCDAAGNVQLQCVAKPTNRTDPQLVHWTKLASNPAIATPPQGVPSNDFRDPTTAWYADGRYRVAVSADINSVGNVVQYSTTDFETFEYDGSLFADPTPSAIYKMLECVDFFNITDGPNATWVVKFSSTALRTDWYALGWYDADRHSFMPTSPLRLLNGGHVYSSKSFHDPVQGRHIVWGWSAEDSHAPQQAGWQGTQTLPGVLTHQPIYNSLSLFPIPEMIELRNHTVYEADEVQLLPNSSLPISLDAGLMIEVRASFPVSTASNPDNLHSSWRKCVDARWSEHSVRSGEMERLCSQHAKIAATSIACSGSPVLQEAGVILRGSAGDSIGTRVSVRSTAQTGPLNNTDLPGGDYRFFAQSASNSAESNIANCSASCRSEAECVAWTYVRDGGPSSVGDGATAVGDVDAFPVPRCALKATVVPTNHNQWCVSGTEASLALVNDLSASGGTGSNPTHGYAFPVLPEHDSVQLAVWMDHSVLESFASAGLARIISRVYPPANATTISLFNAGSTALFGSNVSVFTVGAAVSQ
jgi:sucrose-6-phosphate hydrolase SacC (GH32 family)